MDDAAALPAPLPAPVPTAAVDAAGPAAPEPPAAAWPATARHGHRHRAGRRRRWRGGGLRRRPRPPGGSSTTAASSATGRSNVSTGRPAGTSRSRATAAGRWSDGGQGGLTLPTDPFADPTGQSAAGPGPGLLDRHHRHRRPGSQLTGLVRIATTHEVRRRRGGRHRHGPHLRRRGRHQPPRRRGRHLDQGQGDEHRHDVHRHRWSAPTPRTTSPCSSSPAPRASSTVTTGHRRRRGRRRGHRGRRRQRHRRLPQRRHRQGAGRRTSRSPPRARATRAASGSPG